MCDIPHRAMLRYLSHMPATTRYWNKSVLSLRLKGWRPRHLNNLYNHGKCRTLGILTPDYYTIVLPNRVTAYGGLPAHARLNALRSKVIHEFGELSYNVGHISIPKVLVRRSFYADKQTSFDQGVKVSFVSVKAAPSSINSLMFSGPEANYPGQTKIIPRSTTIRSLFLLLSSAFELGT